MPCNVRSPWALDWGIDVTDEDFELDKHVLSLEYKIVVDVAGVLLPLKRINHGRLRISLFCTKYFTLLVFSCITLLSATMKCRLRYVQSPSTFFLSLAYSRTIYTAHKLTMLFTETP